MAGTVSRLRALLRLILRGPGGREAEVEVVLDTGFTGFLTLPAAAITALSLPFVAFEVAQLADGSRVRLEVYEATVLWDGEERVAFVLAMESRPLLGMSLLDGSEVNLQVTDGGLVTIEPL